MPSRAATFPDVTAFNVRAVGVRDYRRAVVGSAVLGLGSVSAVALMAGTAAVAAAWLVSGALGGNPAFRASAPFALEAAGLPRPPQRLADPADMFGSALAAANPAYGPEGTREAAVTSAVESPVSEPAVTQRRTAALTHVPLPSPRPRVAQIQSKQELARAAAPAIAPAATVESHDDRLHPASVREGATPHQARSEPKLAAVAAAPAAPVSTGSINAVSKPALPRLAYNNPDVPSARDSHTAIYDIVAHTVYLPNGERLEAHSGLGRMLDDPRYVSARGRGATPPNTYDLTLRSGLFHGVQAIRLNPVADGRMYGRDGILAHTYMLGPSGQSFGCVSFRDYPEFLHAFLRGEVDRLVVVPHLSEPPSTVRARRDNGARYAFDIESVH